MAGPPVEVQVRVNTGGSASSNWKVISSGIVTWPFGGKDNGIKKRAIIKAKTRKSKQNKTKKNRTKKKQQNSESLRFPSFLSISSSSLLLVLETVLVTQ